MEQIHIAAKEIKVIRALAYYTPESLEEGEAELLESGEEIYEFGDFVRNLQLWMRGAKAVSYGSTLGILDIERSYRTGLETETTLFPGDDKARRYWNRAIKLAGITIEH